MKKEQKVVEENKKGKVDEWAENARLNEKIEELTGDLQRTRADFENYRKQTEAQQERVGEAAKEDTVRKLLPLLDDIERAIEANPEALGMLEKNFTKTLNEMGLVRIDSAVGAEFNPDLHEAVLVEGEGEREVIGETLRAGYSYGGNVVRAAMVKVVRK